MFSLFGSPLRIHGKLLAAIVFLFICSPFLAAQGPFTCSIAVVPASGTAPLAVTASGSCSGGTLIVSQIVDWGDGTSDTVTGGAYSDPHTYAAAGNFTVTVTAVDFLGNQASASQGVVVTPNLPPTCTLSVSPATGAAPLTVTATGSCTDPENDITTTVLDWGDGTTTTTTSGTHTYQTDGKFNVQLTATDVVGNTGTASQTVDVKKNRPPKCTLNVVPSSGPTPLTVNATGNCTDPDNNLVSTVLDWGDGTTTTNPSGTHTYTAVGTFTVLLTGTDAGGLTGTASQSITVSTNLPPTCTLSVAPTSGVAPLPVTATGSCTDPENDIKSTVLDWGDSTTTPAASGTHTYTASGTFQVTVTATDSAGGKGTAHQTVTIFGAGTCSLQVTPASGQVPLTVSATATCDDPGKTIASTFISFGDGFYQGGLTATHTFMTAGTFNVSVTSVDHSGKATAQANSPITPTDTPTLFVGVSSGQLKQFDKTGKLLKSLDTKQGGSVTGMAFDSLGALYVTDFTADTVTKFSANGTLVGNFGSGYNCKPESIVFDNEGNAYVGETGCSHGLLKFDAYGNLLAGYSVDVENEGSDWIDISSDQCSLFYTSQGTTIFRYDACKGQQLPTFATGLTTGLAVRVLPDAGMLVANQQDIVRFDSAGRIVSHYDATGEDCWVSLTLDPDGKSFWAVDYCSSDIVQFDITSGNQLAKFNSGTSAQTVFGVAMRGLVAQSTPAGPLIASVQNLTVTGGQSGSVKLTFAPEGGAVNETFTFSCANVPIGVSCSFSPATATATSDGVTTTLTLGTTKTAASLEPAPFVVLRTYAIWLFIPGIFVVPGVGRGSRKKLTLGVFFMTLTFLAALFACGGGSSSSTPTTPVTPAPPTPSSLNTPPGTYSIVVRANSNSLASSTAVTLKVQ
jgi:PKD repeat protein